MQAPYKRGLTQPLQPGAARITADTEGKAVVHGDDTVGIVSEVEHGTALVEPDPGLTEALRSRLGWSDDEDAFPLHEAAIGEVIDGEIRLHTGL